MKKISVLLFLLVTLLFIPIFNVKGLEEDTEPDVTVEASHSYINGALSGILIEENTGTILYQKEANKRLAPASMTKIMTLILIYEAMENNSFTKETILTVDEYSSSIGGSQVYLKVGEKITVDEVLKCICIASANDCACLMAVTIAGSEQEFVNMMNKKADELGCTNTLFSDCTGLTSKNHYSSAYDMSLMARELTLKHPDIFSYTSVKEEHIRKDTNNPFWLVNTNKLLGHVDGLDGLKTGYCSFSGYNITLHAKRKSLGLISVVFGYKDSKERNRESLELLNYGYANYEMKLLMKKDTVLETIDSPIYRNKITIKCKDDVFILIKKNTNVQTEMTYNYYFQNDNCEGKVKFKVNDSDIYGYIYTDSIIQKRNLFSLMGYVISRMFI